MTDEPTTPAALPRNREADEWRRKYEAAERDLCRTAVALFLVGLACLALVVALNRVAHQRDAARAALAAAEQRAQVAEERLRGGGRCLVMGDDTGRAWLQNVVVVTPAVCPINGCTP